MRRHLLFSFAASALLLGTAHCGGRVGSIGSGDDGGSGEDGGPQPPPGPTGSGNPVPPGPLQCDPLSVASDPWVTVNEVASNGPAPEGGTIAQGLYALTSLTIYTGPQGSSGGQPGPAQRGSLFVQGRAMLATVEDNQTNSPKTSLIDYSASGSSITYTAVCPTMQGQTIEFTATSQTLVIFAGGGSVSATETFQLQ